VARSVCPAGTNRDPIAAHRRLGWSADARNPATTAGLGSREGAAVEQAAAAVTRRTAIESLRRAGQLRAGHCPARQTLLPVLRQACTGVSTGVANPISSLTLLPL
jgi:hypothetical protein